MPGQNCCNYTHVIFNNIPASIFFLFLFNFADICFLARVSLRMVWYVGSRQAIHHDLNQSWSKWVMRNRFMLLLNLHFMRYNNVRDYITCLAIILNLFAYFLFYSWDIRASSGTYRLLPIFYRCVACRIKTGHSNLVSCFSPRMRALAKVFYRGESRCKISC